MDVTVVAVSRGMAHTAVLVDATDEQVMAQMVSMHGPGTVVSCVRTLDPDVAIDTVMGVRGSSVHDTILGP